MSYSSGPSAQYAADSGFDYDVSTPPPPPPKPAASGPPSGRDTPLRGPPLPPPPPGQAGNPALNGNGMQSSYHQSSAASQHPVVGPAQGWLPSVVQDMSTQDLRELLENSDLQAALLNNPDTSHPSISASQQPLQQLLESNIASATSLQQLEYRLSHQRSATQSRLLSLRALEQQHKAKIVETEDNLRQFSPMALYQRLNSSVQEQDALVKGIEDSFLEESGVASEREIADFVRRVREAKRVAFLRTERKERWDEGRVGGWR
ncbi:hypothetical protein MBLNU459_g6876t1 [Dothideomycetes sp. NU459]